MAATVLIGSLLLVLTTRGVINHQPVYDELVHVLAARGLLKTGQPVIADGVYDRAELFTRVVAASFRIAGDNLVSARLPALLCGMALVALMGGWVTRRAGLLAGISSAIVLAIAPASTELSVLARFYTMHALAVAVMLIAGYEATSPRRPPQTRIALVTLVLVAGSIAWHLQVTTAIAIGAGAFGLAATASVDHWTEVRTLVVRHSVLCAVGAIAVTTIAAIVASRLGLFEQLREAPLWDQGNAGKLGYYNTALVKDLPLFWPLLPIAALVALRSDQRLALFCIGVSGIGLLVHSIAAQKALRYVYYLLPFLAVLWGCGAAAAASHVAEVLKSIAPGLRSKCVSIGVLLMVFTLANSQEGQRACRLMVGRESKVQTLSFAGEADWARAMAALRPIVPTVNRIVVSNSMKALYVLGNYDVAINANDVLESESGKEFGRDPRTGRPAIGTAESMAKVIGRHGRTLVIVEDEKLGQAAGVAMEVVALLEASCQRVVTPQSSGVTAWLCMKQSPDPV